MYELRALKKVFLVLLLWKGYRDFQLLSLKVVIIFANEQRRSYIVDLLSRILNFLDGLFAFAVSTTSFSYNFRAKKIFDVANEETASEMMSVSSADVESEPSTKTAIIEDEEIESTEKSELVFADQEIISEPDDGSQAEIVLTVEENAIEDADAGIVNVNSERYLISHSPIK